MSTVKGHCICSRSAAGFLLMIETQGLDWRAGSEHRQTPKWRPGPLARLYRARKLTQLGPVFHRLDLIAGLPLIRSPSACSRSPTMMPPGPTARPGNPSLAAGGLAPARTALRRCSSAFSPSFCREFQNREAPGARLGTTAGNRSARYMRPRGSLRRYDR